MIELSESVIESFAVLQSVISKSEGLRGYAECYQNGREQGFLIYGLKDGNAIYWSHHRNSDSLIIYFGKYSLQSISEDACKNTYCPSDMFDAVNYIVDLVKNNQ